MSEIPSRSAAGAKRPPAPPAPLPATTARVSPIVQRKPHSWWLSEQAETPWRWWFVFGAIGFGLIGWLGYHVFMPLGEDREMTMLASATWAPFVVATTQIFMRTFGTATITAATMIVAGFLWDTLVKAVPNDPFYGEPIVPLELSMYLLPIGAAAIVIELAHAPVAHRWSVKRGLIGLGVALLAASVASINFEAFGLYALSFLLLLAPVSLFCWPVCGGVYVWIHAIAVNRASKRNLAASATSVAGGAVDRPVPLISTDDAT